MLCAGFETPLGRLLLDCQLNKKAGLPSILLSTLLIFTFFRYFTFPNISHSHPHLHYFRIHFLSRHLKLFSPSSDSSPPLNSYLHLLTRFLFSFFASFNINEVNYYGCTQFIQREIVVSRDRRSSKRIRVRLCSGGSQNKGRNTRKHIDRVVKPFDKRGSQDWPEDGGKFLRRSYPL